MSARDRPPLLIVLHDGGTGGAETAVHRVLPCLVGRWRVAVWMPHGTGVHAVADVASDVRAQERPIRYSLRGLREPPGAVRRLVATVPYLIRFARHVRRLRPAVVHANTFYALPEATVARALGIPVVVHVHDILPPGRKSRVIHAWCRWVGTRTVACSNAAAEPLEAAAGRSVRVIANAVPLPDGERRPDRARPVVGTLARLERRKGIDLFLDAVARVHAARPSVRVRIWGPDGTGADRPYAAAIHARVAAMTQAGLDVAVAEVPDAANAIRDWGVFVLASRQDPYPLSVLEAMAWGVPVVASAVGGIPDQVEDGVSGILVPPGDPGALADAVLALLDDPARAADLGRAARRRVAAWSVEDQANALSAVYRELSSSKRA